MRVERILFGGHQPKVPLVEEIAQRMLFSTMLIPASTLTPIMATNGCLSAITEALDLTA